MPKGVKLRLEEIPGALVGVDGFSRMQWPRVAEAVKPFAGHQAVDEIWTALAAQWLAVVGAHLGKHYRIYHGEHLLLLSAQTPMSAKNTLATGDAAYKQLEQLLQRKTEARGLGKHAVLVLAAQKVYYDYISHFYPESDRVYGMSGGVHITRGYRHTVVNEEGNRSILRTLVHELAHDMVHDRPLPRWLNEGLAQFAEDLVPGYRAPLIDARQARLQRRYWSWFGIDRFWDGRAFLEASSQRVSYQLANVLFRNMAGDRVRSRQLGEFIGTAHRDDAGQAACQACMGCSLAALVREFLGPGNWEPALKETESVAVPKTPGP